MLGEGRGDALHLFEGPVEEEIRGTDLGAVDDGRRVEPRGDHLALGHQPALDEIGQDLVGAGAGGRQVDMRRIARRRLEQAGEHGAFGKVDVGDRLAEIELRRRRRAERAAAHIGAVEIEPRGFPSSTGWLSSQTARKASLILRSIVRSFDRNRFLASCCVSVEPPWTTPPARAFSLMAREQAEEIDAEMVEEAAVLGGEHRLDQRVRQFVDRHGILVDDAAMADVVAVAIEEGDGEIACVAPVALGLLESRQARAPASARSRRCPRSCLRRASSNTRLLPAAHGKAAEEDGDVLPRFAEAETGVPDGRIDPVNRSAAGSGASRRGRLAGLSSVRLSSGLDPARHSSPGRSVHAGRYLTWRGFTISTC